MELICEHTVASGCENRQLLARQGEDSIDEDKGNRYS